MSLQNEPPLKPNHTSHLERVSLQVRFETNSLSVQRGKKKKKKGSCSLYYTSYVSKNIVFSHSDRTFKLMSITYTCALSI